MKSAHPQNNIAIYWKRRIDMNKIDNGSEWKIIIVCLSKNQNVDINYYLIYATRALCSELVSE